MLVATFHVYSPARDGEFACAEQGANVVAGSMNTDGVNLELFFVTEVLQLKSLHYGYWAEPSAAGRDILDLSDIKQAQESYTRELLQTIPAEVQSVLDVGCGIGDNARALLSRGLKVTALSPDENHKRYFEDIREPNLSFLSGRFEDFQTDEIFDLVLMSESQNYFDAEIGLQQARRYLRAGGYLLIAGMFRKDCSTDFNAIPNGKRDYLDKAAKNGFATLETRDITRHVLPTIQIVNRTRLLHLEPSLDLAQRYLRASMPLKLKLLKLLFRKQIKELAELASYYAKRTNPALFAAQVEYLIVLLQAQRVPAK